MTSERRRDLVLTYGLPAAVAAAVIVLQLFHFGGLYAASDDSYIYLGYVKRALQPPRGLFSYNPGEHSAGTTGILYYYTLIVAAAVMRVFTFPLSFPTTLMLALYALNAALFVACAGLLVRVARQIAGGSEGSREIWGFVAFLLLLWNPKFTWGIFAGLENPLSAFLVVALVHALAHGWSALRIAALAGLLVATRPELVATVAIAPALAAIAARRRLHTASRSHDWHARLAWAGGTAWRAAAASAVFAAVIAVLVLPCWITTGRIFPSSFGARVNIAALANVGALWHSIAIFDARALWLNPWALASIALLLCLVAVAPYRDVRVPLAAMAFVTWQFCVRVILQLSEYAVEDRYVSYLWPLYVIAIIPLLHGIVGASRIAATTLARPRAALAVCAVLVAVTVLGPLREFDERFSADVREMNQVVVAPALWMQEHLPPSSRVAMEPAGAIRVFTDFHLVDAVGLTTNNSLPYGSYAKFMTDNRVDYAFDYPVRVAELADEARYERVMTWRPEPRRYSWGEIGLFRMRAR